jgi:hypothetical protein
MSAQYASSPSTVCRCTPEQRETYSTARRQPAAAAEKAQEAEAEQVRDGAELPG